MSFVLPASAPRPVSAMRVLVVDGTETNARPRILPAGALAQAFAPGDLVIVNDAGTLPASLHAHTRAGARIELRLVANVDGARHWTAALLGAGDHRMRTEDRPPPPAIGPDDRLLVDGPDGLVAVVTQRHALSPRLVDVSFELPLRGDADEARIWRALYLAGKPVQYAHVRERLALWDVQNAWAARPWAVEMPSAGRVLTVAMLRALRERGAFVARVTHAAGLSSVGDPAIDAALPFAERFEVPNRTVSAIDRARACGGRIIAVGTSVTRALEASVRLGVLAGVTDLRLGPTSRRITVDAILTGVHETGTSHHSLLRSFARAEVLEEASRISASEQLFGHELGDAWLVWGQPAENSASRAGRGRDTVRRSEAGGPLEAPIASAIDPGW